MPVSCRLTLNKQLYFRPNNQIALKITQTDQCTVLAIFGGLLGSTCVNLLNLNNLSYCPASQE